MAIALSVAEVALALLVAWLLTRSGVPRHASRSVDMGAADVFILVALLSCLGLFVFVLAFWQWRLAGRDRVRMLLAGYLSLTVAFLGLCWYDVSVRSGELPGAPTALRRVVEQTVASGLTLGALLAGLCALAVVLRAARKSLKPATPSDIVEGGPGDPSSGRETPP